MNIFNVAPDGPAINLDAVICIDPVVYDGMKYSNNDATPCYHYYIVCHTEHKAIHVECKTTNRPNMATANALREKMIAAWTRSSTPSDPTINTTKI